MTGILRRMRHGMYVLFVALLIAVTGTVHAEGEEAQERVTQEDAAKLSEDAAESLFDELDTDQIDRVLKEAYSREKVRFRDVVQAMMDGEQTISPELIVDFVADTLFGLVRHRHNRRAVLAAPAEGKQTRHAADASAPDRCSRLHQFLRRVSKQPDRGLRILYRLYSSDCCLPDRIFFYHGNGRTGAGNSSDLYEGSGSCLFPVYDGSDR